MTNKEAIDVLNLVNRQARNQPHEFYEALYLAIKALEQTEVKGDLISREALKQMLPAPIEDEYKRVHQIIDNAPTVDLWKMRQEATENALKKAEVLYGRPKGKPIIKCQNCKYRVKEWREDKRMKEKGYWIYGCEHFGEIMGYWGFGGYDDEFCSDAERKGGAE